MHKMFGQDPRSLRPVNRDEQDTRFKPVYRRSRRGRKGSGQDSERGTGEPTVKDETYTPAMSDTIRFEDMDTLNSPLPGSVYSMGSDMASPSTLDSLSPTGPIYSAFPYDGHESPFRIPFSGPTRSATVFSSSTEMSTDSVRGLRERLGISTNFAKQVTVLMNRLTISGSDPMPSPHRTASDIPMYRQGHPGPVPHPGLAVPGDFMVSPRYVHSCQGEKHFAKYLRESKCACWCTITDETSEDSSENFYVTANGEWCDRAENVRNGTTEANCVDDFGNTPLHLFAALGCDVGVQTVLDLVGSGRANPLAVNKADQTFLHVLSAAWFRKLGDLDACLYRLLQLLWDNGASKALFLRDVYGRTFFHQLDRFVDDIHIFTYISKHYTWPIPRDAFGVHPPSHASDHTFPAPRRVGTTPLSPLAEEITPEEFATKEQKLLTVINQAYTIHDFEDGEGRNGLHCLAELSPGALTSSNPSNPSSPDPDQPAASNGNKRKRGDKEADGPKPIERRAQYLSNLLLSNTKVTPPDVNHYDKSGRTVLMAFAAHLTDEQDKSGQHIARIVDVLVERGAKVEARNKRGETALLVAARHGNKHVVNRLAERGANLHARDKDGRGIMGILEVHLARCERNLPSYGRLEAVRGLVAKRLEETKGEDEPSFLDEWRGPLASRARQ